MSGSLRDAWEYLAADLWEPLAEYSVKDAMAPAGRPFRLLRAVATLPDYHRSKAGWFQASEAHRFIRPWHRDLFTNQPAARNRIPVSQHC